MSEKITPGHLERAAYVYVRQSTLHQVRHNLESQRRQYGLAERARQLGFRQVHIIDEDLGRSGSGTQERPGFARLVAAVCGGEVGAVFATEASRLARNNRDWHHLVDLCTMTNTLLIDHDGTYNPRQLNDRLLLGLKGTMSEFELGLLRQRAREALRQKIQRGEVLFEAPIGHVRTDNNGMAFTADLQVQQAVRGVFAKFAELGSVRQVLLWYRQERIPLPTWNGYAGKAEIVWRLPSYHRILSMIKNPAYAGAFVYGRTQTRTVVVDGRARKTRGHNVPRSKWEVLIPDHHPGYISWEQYLKNQRQVENNAGMNGSLKPGPAKSGAAMLAGLLRCARCGRKLHVGYSGIGGRVPRYYCRGAHLNHGTKWCLSFGGLRVDQAVVDQVLEALEPVGIESSLQAWQRMQDDQDQKREALQLSVQKAHYESDRTRRQYDAVDPANRLVADELERRWNEALQRAAELEERLSEDASDRINLSGAERQRLLELGGDLKQLWEHSAASIALKKRILRTVVQEIVVDVNEELYQIELRLHWAGGVHTPLRVPKNRTGRHQRCTDRAVVDLVCELAKVCDDRSIAAILNRLGYRTGAGNMWTQSRVCSLRSYQSIPMLDPAIARTWTTLTQAAAEWGVSQGFVRRLIRQKILPAHQVVENAPWVIEREALDLAVVKAEVTALREGRKTPSRAVSGNEMPLFSST
ncbi:MAG: recombinase family protein [Phycisphaerae bacterium]